jgi:2,4-dichlorophenol 6-monooxygenase
MFAKHLQKGRVFCAGDAIHRHPPSNGLGSNTSIQDSYNLAWKLALVLRGQAEPSLLDTYSAERAPVAERIVRRANQSSREFVQFFEVLGLLDATTEDEMRAAIEERKANTPSGAAKRAALIEAMDLKNYEFNAHGMDLGQFYESGAVVSDGSALPSPARDADLYYEMSTVPGSHLPHAWVGDTMSKLAMMDLAPYDRFTVFTGIAGAQWTEASDKVAHDLGVPLETVVIGPGQAVTDLYYDWAKLRAVEEGGAVLVRPDKHIAWRCMTMPSDPEGALRTAMRQVLGKG